MESTLKEGTSFTCGAHQDRIRPRSLHALFLRELRSFKAHRPRNAAEVRGQDNAQSKGLTNHEHNRVTGRTRVDKSGNVISVNSHGTKRLEPSLGCRAPLPP